jgi:hypothetical protein
MNLNKGDRVIYTGHSNGGQYQSEGVVFDMKVLTTGETMYYLKNERDGADDSAREEDIIQILP